MKKIVMVFFISLLLAGCTQENKEGIDYEEVMTDSGDQSEDTGMTEEETNAGQPGEKSVIQWDEKRVVIPEVERDYEIWFFADSHIIISDDSESEEVQAYAAERMPVFTNEMGIAPSEILTQFVEQANEQKPDMVLFGGDILDFPSEENVTFLKEELAKITIPYVYVMGNHDWTFPWEYMTPEGTAQYRPLYEEVLYGNFMQEDAPGTEDGERTADEEGKSALDVVKISGNSYSSVVELDDLVVLAVDDSSNQVAAGAMEHIEDAYGLDKPVILMQHVPFSTEKLIAEAKNYWANPVTLGMQVHGGIPTNDVSADLYDKVLDDESMIRLVLAGHVHFPYEEKISEQTVEIITDAAFKGKAVKLHIVAE